MKKLSFYFLLLVSLFLAKKTLAVCPLCTVAVGAGVGFSRWLGIDDTITGLWLGGLIVSVIIWTENWLEKRNVRFRGRILINILVYYTLVIVPLYYSGIMGHSLNKLCFCGLKFDRLLFGIIAGSIAFWFGASWYPYLKAKNQGKAYFPFQKVIMPVLPLIVLSIIYYFLTK